MFSESPESFLMNSSVAIHAVSADGIILYANQYELEMLGYTEDEYVGHHTSEFQMDKECLDLMLAKLSQFENLKNFPARVKGKFGIKYILYNSSVYQENGQFVHTRCFGMDVEQAVHQIFVQNLS